jgi:indolepyruvate ferredoxin oxidoreductase alpha subunit
MKRLLLGNEAIALGAYLAGARAATGYPGTPSTEILEAFARYPGVYAEWSPNEKVALEVAFGLSLGGKRALVTMKHVGLNVAADPFFAIAYTGVHAGLVVVSADDPGMHSSQGEQDNRHYARFAKVPLLEPADSQECFDMVRVGFQISEAHDTPVLLRITGRVAHAQSVVDLPEETPQEEDRRGPFQPEPAKYVMLPSYARGRRLAMEQRLARLEALAEESPLNCITWQDSALGIVADSVAYLYAREVFPRASFLKLGFPYPFPRALVRTFARSVRLLLVVEELDPFLEEQVRLALESEAPPILGKEVVPAVGELSPELLARAARQHPLLREHVWPEAGEGRQPLGLPLPPRPPVLCAGCPHRATFDALARLVRTREAGQERVIVTGDIGCYTLGALPPLLAMDTCTCMGASIGAALGLEKAGLHGRVIAVIGDSTFYHSGITGLVDVVSSGAATTVIILDNGTTAMTGGNPNPGSGQNLRGEPAPRVELERLCRGLGIEDVRVLDAWDRQAIEAALCHALSTNAPSVLIIRGPCQRTLRRTPEEAAVVEASRCTGCRRCLRLGCPALTFADGKALVLTELCAACGLCAGVCPRGAIHLRRREEVPV